MSKIIKIKNINDIRKNLKTKFFEIDDTLIRTFKCKDLKNEEIKTMYDIWLKRYWISINERMKIFKNLKELKLETIKLAKNLWLKDTIDVSLDNHLDFLEWLESLDKDISNFDLKTVADLKRLPIGTFLRRIYTPKKTWLWVFTKIKSLQSNAFNLEYDETWKTSYLEFPKASDCKIDWNKIIYYVHWTKEIDLAYEIYKDENLSLNEMNEKYWKNKIFSNFNLEEIESISRSKGLAIVFLKNNEIFFVSTMNEFIKLWKTIWDLTNIDISKVINDKRYRRWIAYSIGKDFAITINSDTYKIFKNLEIVYNNITWYNLIKGDWELYEIAEDSYKSEWKNYGDDIFIKYNWKVDISKWKSQKEIEIEIKENNIKKDIEEKITEVIDWNYKYFTFIKEENSLKYLKANGFKIAPIDFEKNMDDRNTYLTTNLEKEGAYLLATVRKNTPEEYRNKNYTTVSMKKRKHIEVNKNSIENLKIKYDKIIESLDLLESTEEKKNPIVILRKQLESELSNWRKEGTIYFKDWTSEKRRLFKGTQWFWYLPKGKRSKGYVLTLDNIEKIEF